MFFFLIAQPMQVGLCPGRSPLERGVGATAACWEVSRCHGSVLSGIRTLLKGRDFHAVQVAFVLGRCEDAKPSEELGRGTLVNLV